ncbi:MAG: helix-turn-helix domain-containing protein [Actinomycetota bacterium]
MDLLTLLKQPEGKTLEFKRDLSSPDGVLRTIVAFANTAGGIVLLGVEDETRRMVGIADPLSTEERLANLVSDSICPPVIPDIETLPWRRTHILAVRVYPSSTTPHYLRRPGPEAGVFIRVGSTNRRADPVLIEGLRRHARSESFDEQPVPGLSSEAIDFRAASELFVPVRALTKTDLITLRLVTRYQARVVPTVGGILLFGKEREHHFPDAWIQAGRFVGTDRRRIIDTAEIHTHLVPAVEEAIRFVQRNTAREAVIRGVRRMDRWTYPLEAVREAVVNAVVHADYAQHGAPIRLSVFDDRIEVENPGLLPFGLTIDEVKRGISKLRNRVIGRVFHELGLIEQWGSGIQRMTAACEQAGLPAPLLEEIGIHFRLTLSSSRIRRPKLEKVDAAILQMLSAGEGLSTHEIARRIDRSERATRSRLASLVKLGLVVEVGAGPHDPRRRYFLSETGGG